MRKKIFLIFLIVLARVEEFKIQYLTIIYAKMHNEKVSIKMSIGQGIKIGWITTDVEIRRKQLQVDQKPGGGEQMLKEVLIRTEELGEEELIPINELSTSVCDKVEEFLIGKTKKWKI